MSSNEEGEEPLRKPGLGGWESEQQLQEALGLDGDVVMRYFLEEMEKRSTRRKQKKRWRRPAPPGLVPKVNPKPLADGDH